MRIKIDRERRKVVFYLRNDNYVDLAWLTLGFHGLQMEIEFPSDWHEHPQGWLRLGFGFGSLNVAFPWSKMAPDEGQCSGPRYGFQFHSDMLWLYYGQDTGRSADRGKFGRAFSMPWAWRHLKNEVLSDEEAHPYLYVMRNGTVQNRVATISMEYSSWWRPWPLFFKSRRYIDVSFDKGVGERVDSWKGGVYGCGYEVKRGEAPVQALRRMERERRFE